MTTLISREKLPKKILGEKLVKMLGVCQNWILDKNLTFRIVCIFLYYFLSDFVNVVIVASWGETECDVDVLRKSFVFHLSYTRKKSNEKQNPIFLLSSSSISTEYKWRKCTIVRTFKKAATINYEPESLLRHQIHNKRRELPWKPPFYSSFQPFIMTLFFILFHHLSSTFLMTII